MRKDEVGSKLPKFESKYTAQAQKLFGGFTPYSPPSSNYYYRLGQRAYKKKQEEEELEKQEDSLLSKYGIDSDDSSYSVKSDDYLMDTYEDEEEKEEKKEKKNSFLDDIGAGFKAAFKAANPFDDESMSDALMKFANRNKSEGFKELQRGSNRAVDSASLGALSAIDRKMTGDTPYYMTKRGVGEGGVTDVVTSGLGYLVPGVGAYKALGATKAGRGLEALGQQGLKQRIGAEAAKGAITGAGVAGAEIGIREGITPEAYNASDNLKHLGLGTTVGAIADPALYGAGRAIQSILKRGKSQLPIKESVLGLPEPQMQLPSPKSVEPSLESLQGAFKQPTGLQSPIPQMPKPMSEFMTKTRLEGQGLNFGFNTKNAPKARKDLSPVETSVDPLNRGQEYWIKRYEDFANEVNSRHDLNQLTPEALEDLWSSFAKYDEPLKLDQVVDLAYPKGYEPPKTQPIKEEVVPTVEEPRISRKATFNEMVDYMEQLAPPKKTQQEPSLLQFKKEVLVKPNGLEKVTSPKFAEVQKKEDFDPTKLKDISGFKAATTDVYRNFENVFGKNYENVGKPVLDKLDSAKSEYVNMQEKWVNNLNNNVVKKLGIKKGSKESKWVQQYGEGEISLEQLKKVAPDKWKDVVKADQWFRRSYDQLIDEVNASRAVIYPNNPEKIVPKRKDYYRHFREMEGLSGLKNLFDSPSQIDPHLAGTSQYTTPKSKFAGFMQKRGNGPFKRDAVGGFLDYIPAASYSTKIDPVIPEFRNLKNSLADQTEGSRNLNNFIEYLDDYANDLAGKTNPFDRVPQKYIPGGRKTFNIINRLNSRVKANVILGNVSSALAQTANIPIGVAYGKQHAVTGAVKSLEALVNKKSPMYQSAFLKERYSDNMYRKFDDKWFQQPQKMAEWVLETADKIGSSFVWNTTYEKAIKQGVKDPVKFADNETRKLLAGRGVGEVPLFQKSRITQILLPFTLEVGNQWRVMGDMVKGKDVTAIMLLFTGNYLLNNVMEETRGFGVTFDPIEAGKDAISDKELTNTERVGRVAGEVLSNTPAGQYLAELYPEYGFEIPFTDIEMPTRNKMFGDRNPQRFGGGIVAMDGLTDPIFKLAPPFGGNQIKKTIDGVTAISEEGVYNKDKTELKYPIEPNTENKIRAGLFGPSSFSESREYYDNKNRPLSEKQTENYELLKPYGKGDEYYKDLQKERDVKTIERKIKEVDEDEKMTYEEKRNQLLYLYSELQKLQ